MSVSVPKLNLSMSSTGGGYQSRRSANKKTPGQSRRKGMINPAQYSKRSSRSNRSTMSNARRERLLNLQKREKLKALLVKKFRMQFGTGRQMTAIITKAIDQFVTRKKVTEKDLDGLGKQLEAAAKQLRAAGGNVNLSSSRAGGGSRKPRLSQSRQLQSQRQDEPQRNLEHETAGGPRIASMGQSASAPSLTNDNGSPMKKPGRLAPLKNSPAAPLRQMTPQQMAEEVEEDWSLIFRYQQKKGKEDSAKDKAKFKRVRQETLNSLAIMSEEKSKLRARAKKYDDDYAKSIQENMKKWKVEEDEKATRRKDAIKKQSETRRKQMEERKARAEKEKNDQLKWETNLMRRLNRETMIQKEREKRKIIEDKKRLITFLAGNADHRKHKEDAIRKEREEDVRRMKEYAKILENQENARKEFFAKRGEKQAKFMKANVAAREDEFASIRANELRDLRFQKEKEDQSLRKEAEAKARRKKNQDDINKWLNDTIKKKAEKKKKEKDRYIEINNYAKQKAAEVSLRCIYTFFAPILLTLLTSISTTPSSTHSISSTVQARAQEEEERRKRRKMQRQYQKELAEQVAGREHLYHYVGRVRKRKYASMSDREKALNKSLIKEIRQKAPELLSPVKSPPKVSEEEEYSSGIY